MNGQIFLTTAREVNDFKPQYLIAKIMQIAKSYDNPVIACLGLTFKANVSDLRESPALEITKVIAEQNFGRLFIAEPFITSLPKSLAKFENLQLVGLEEALQKADIIILLVDHHAFREVDRSLLQKKIVIDTRGIWQ